MVSKLNKLLMTTKEKSLSLWASDDAQDILF